MCICLKMRRIILFFAGIILVALVEVRTQKDAIGIDMWNGIMEQDDRHYMSGSVLPKPQFQELTNNYTINPRAFTFTSEGQSSSVLLAAMKRYEKLTFPSTEFPLQHQDAEEVWKNAGTLPAVIQLKIIVQEPMKPLELDSDESYSLEVSSPYSVLKTPTVWGALRGLETFSQLVFEPKLREYQIRGSKIRDFPRYRHRGFLIDTGRHYLPLNVIFKHLDAMSYVKYNVLHWHIVDDQSFPYVSKVFPDLSKTASFTPDEVYTPEQVQEVIEYARLRGIRVMPEFDSPGHTYSWRSIPDLLTSCPKPGWSKPGVGPVNPALPSTYEFWRKFLAEVKSVFPDKFIHLGGDEVHANCWTQNYQVKEFMKRNNMATIADLEEYYFKGIVGITEKLDRKVMMWQEVVDTGVKLPKDSVIHIWKDEWQNEISKVAEAGLDMVISSCWYLNIVNYGTDWHPYYNCEFENKLANPLDAKRILGGTTCMWGSGWMQRIYSQEAGEEYELSLDSETCTAEKNGPDNSEKSAEHRLEHATSG